MTVWLFSFIVHSTLWCGVAWLCLRLFPGVLARLRETIWHTALAASLITPTVHTITSQQSAIWRLPLPSFVAGGEHHSGEDRGHEDGAAAVATVSRQEAHGEETAVSAIGMAAAGTLWLALAVSLLALYFLRLKKLRRRLRDRTPVVDPRALNALAALSGRAGLESPPRLTKSRRLGSPVALGLGTRREICVPVRALRELDERELRALFGHEIAHHLRRDVIRLAILNVVQAVFFFQPLFRLAVREARLAAEEQCDDWAANQFDDRVAMASCLTEVARWVVRSDRRTPVPCMGRHRSQLELRVRRLIDGHRSSGTPSPTWRRAGAVGLLALAPLFAPAVAPATGESHEERPVSTGVRPFVADKFGVMEGVPETGTRNKPTQ